MSRPQHPSDAIDVFNARFKTSECVGDWLVYFTGFVRNSSGQLEGTWVASRPLVRDATALQRTVRVVNGIFGRCIWAEDLLTQRGLREIEHVVVESKDKLLADIARR